MVGDREEEREAEMKWGKGERGQEGKGKEEMQEGRGEREGDPLVSKLLSENINSTKSIKRAFFP